MMKDEKLRALAAECWVRPMYDEEMRARKEFAGMDEADVTNFLATAVHRGHLYVHNGKWKTRPATAAMLRAEMPDLPAKEGKRTKFNFGYRT